VNTTCHVSRPIDGTAQLERIVFEHGQLAIHCNSHHVAVCALRFALEILAMVKFKNMLASRTYWTLSSCCSINAAVPQRRRRIPSSTGHHTVVLGKAKTNTH
jgi:hypothetical protein